MTYKSLALLVVFMLIESTLCCVAMAAPDHVLSVGLGGGYDFTNIQAAIDVASNGDTIVVNPGTYSGSINFLTKDIHLVSTDPTDANVREATVLSPPSRIDASTNGSLQGFRINGHIGFCGIPPLSDRIGTEKSRC